MIRDDDYTNSKELEKVIERITEQVLEWCKENIDGYDSLTEEEQIDVVEEHVNTAIEFIRNGENI